MKRKPLVLVVKELRVRRCKQAVTRAQQAVQEQQRRVRAALQRVEDLRALQARNLVGADGARRSGYDLVIACAAYDRLGRVVADAQMDQQAQERALQRAESARERAVRAWRAAEESLRLACERLAEQRRLASTIRAAAEDEDIAETRTAIARSAQPQEQTAWT